MKIETQKSGTPLSDEETKLFTALLVKMGYTVRVRREKDGERTNRIKRTIYAEEEA